MSTSYLFCLSTRCVDNVDNFSGKRCLHEKYMCISVDNFEDNVDYIMLYYNYVTLCNLYVT